MRLTPLKQWICDTCRQVIESPDDGWLEWITDDDHAAQGFRIVHHMPKSPRRNGCYQHGKNDHRQDTHLSDFVGVDGMAYLLALLDAGYCDPNGGCDVKSTREFADLVRRLQVPHYEEARLYWSKAEQDGYFDGANQVSPYTQATLTRIVEQYSDEIDD